MSSQKGLGGTSAEESGSLSLGQVANTNPPWGVLRASGAASGTKLWETRDLGENRLRAWLLGSRRSQSPRLTWWNR